MPDTFPPWMRLEVQEVGPDGPIGDPVPVPFKTPATEGTIRSELVPLTRTAVRVNLTGTAVRVSVTVEDDHVR
jgi:hypothetical protein